MEEKILEVGCHLLQSEYLERRGLGDKTLEELANSPNVFPTSWQSYLIEDRVEFLQQALKDNVDLDMVIANQSDANLQNQELKK